MGHDGKLRGYEKTVFNFRIAKKKMEKREKRVQRSSRRGGSLQLMLEGGHVLMCGGGDGMCLAGGEWEETTAFTKK